MFKVKKKLNVKWILPGQTNRPTDSLTDLMTCHILQYPNNIEYTKEENRMSEREKDRTNHLQTKTTIFGVSLWIIFGPLPANSSEEDLRMCFQ